ncbi:MAG: Uma2 family endonuclease, partial [Desulfobulbaceae bacterium]|nr:Uma2 family endonuclease [Desulfobulbaceae bacterium]
LDTTSCEIFIAPFDVRLTNKPEANDEEINTVVQPDLLVVCDQNKLDERGCKGPPDLIIEILSPSTAIVDLKTKRDLYERHGVREYWIVHPTDKTLMIYRLSNDGEYKKASVLGAEDIATSDTINAIRIVLSEIFGTDEETTPFSTPPSSEPQ